MTTEPTQPVDRGAVEAGRARVYLAGTHGVITLMHATAAAAHATLALVEEQRTANLIAAMREARENGQGDYQMALGDQVAARLGL